MASGPNTKAVFLPRVLVNLSGGHPRLFDEHIRPYTGSTTSPAQESSLTGLALTWSSLASSTTVEKSMCTSTCSCATDLKRTQEQRIRMRSNWGVIMVGGSLEKDWLVGHYHVHVVIRSLYSITPHCYNYTPSYIAMYIFCISYIISFQLHNVSI